MTYETETAAPPEGQAVSRVDSPLDRRRVGDIKIDRFAGLTMDEYRQAVEWAKIVAHETRYSIPEYLKGYTGDVLAVMTQALRWRLEPIWVMQQSYVARKEGIITYNAAVHAAIIISSGALASRPRYIYQGEGEERTCTVVARFRGEEEAHEYTTPPLHQCRPRRNEQGQVRGSPLWDKDPDQQLGYYAVRNWGRRHAPEILGGVWDREEFEDATQEAAPPAPTSPNLLQRLPGKMEGAGFAENVVDAALGIEADQKAAAKKAAAKAQDAPQSDAAPAATPDAPEPVKPVPEPTTAEQYIAYARGWIEAGTNPDNLEARWDGEREMRQGLKPSLPIAARKLLESLIAEQVAALQKKPRKRK